MKNPQGLQVLIVEDEFLVGEMIKRMLEEGGYIVAGMANNGWQGVKMAETLKPDVIMMDIQMPDMDGITASQRIYQYCPTPIVILTAHNSLDLVAQAGQAGAGAYLIKPPNVREMERAIAIARARFDDMMALRQLNLKLAERNRELEQALATVKQLSGLLPICASCKKIRDDEGYWHEVEKYIREHSDASFSHGICPNCAQTLYPDSNIYKDGP